MSARPLLLAITALLAVCAQAETAALPTPADLVAAQQQQQAAEQALQRQTAEAQAAVDKWYAAELAALREAAIKAGDLERVLALDAERARLGADITPEEKARLFYALRELRRRYDRERAEVTRHSVAQSCLVRQTYVLSLGQLEGLLAAYPAAAAEVRRVRLELAGPIPTTACALPAVVASQQNPTNPTNPVNPTNPTNPTRSRPVAVASISTSHSVSAFSTQVPKAAAPKPAVVSKSEGSSSSNGSSASVASSSTTKGKRGSRNGKGKSAVAVVSVASTKTASGRTRTTTPVAQPSPRTVARTGSIQRGSRGVPPPAPTAGSEISASASAGFTQVAGVRAIR